MRTIKFRAWSKALERIIPFEEIEIYETGKLCEALAVNTDHILMQFTGLLDKNGKEIYEGDIIEAAPENTKFIWEVIWVGIDSAFELKRKESYLFFPSINHGEQGMETIGNIYENPELLT